MAQKLNACCEAARAEYVARVVKSTRSYPIIKSIPCPTCRSIVPIRLYGPPPSESDAA